MQLGGDAPLVAHVVYRFDTGRLENSVANLIKHLPADCCYRHLVITLTEVTGSQWRTVSTIWPTSRSLSLRGMITSYKSASGVTASRACSSMATANSRRTDGKSLKNTSSESVAARWSKGDFTGIGSR